MAIFSLIIYACLSYLVAAQLSTTDNLFIYPTAPGPNGDYVSNDAFSLGSVQDIQWETTLDSYFIIVSQEASGGGAATPVANVFSVESGGAGQQSLNWTVTSGSGNIQTSPVFFFWLFSHANSSEQFTSHYFNITAAVSSSSPPPSSSSSVVIATSALSTSTSSTATSSISTSTTTTTTAPASTTVLPTSASQSDSTAIKVGLGVGLGVGVPLLLLGGIWLGMRLVKAHRNAPPPQYMPHVSAPARYYDDVSRPTQASFQPLKSNSGAGPHAGYQQWSEMNAHMSMGELGGPENTR